MREMQQLFGEMLQFLAQLFQEYIQVAYQSTKRHQQGNIPFYYKEYPFTPRPTSLQWPLPIFPPLQDPHKFSFAFGLSQLFQQRQVLKMTNSATLSEHLLHLRGLIADRHDTPTLLLEADKLISLEKHLHPRKNDVGVDALQQQIKALSQKLKQAGKEKRSKEDLINNLQRDLEIMGVKCRNLEERLQHENLASARERRKETRVERRNTAEIEVQVETLCPVAFENLVRNYRSELNENDRLRLELRELREMQEEEEGDGSVASTEACCQSDVEMEMEITPGESVSQAETETPREVSPWEGSGMATEGQRQSAFDLICSVSRQVLNYFKDQ